MEKEKIAAAIEAAAAEVALHDKLPKPSELINQAWWVAYQGDPKGAMVVGAFRYNWDMAPPENPAEFDRIVLQTLIGLRRYKEEVNKIAGSEADMIQRLTEYLNGTFKSLAYPGYCCANSNGSEAPGGGPVVVRLRIPLPAQTATANIRRSRESTMTLNAADARASLYPRTDAGFQVYFAEVQNRAIQARAPVLGFWAIGTIHGGQPDTNVSDYAEVVRKLERTAELHRRAFRRYFDANSKPVVEKEPK